MKAPMRPARATNLPVACVLTLVLGTAFTATATWFVSVSQSEVERQRFKVVVDAAVAEISQRVNLYEYGLRGARGLFAASKSVERSEFREYFESRRHHVEFPGALGVGFIKRVEREHLAEYVAAVRADGAPHFEVRTEGDASNLYVIQYVEPRADNESAIGYDVGSEPTRRAAAEHAMYTGRGTITAKIELLQRPGEPGFLYMLPFYERGTNPETAEERERLLVGWLYMPLIASPILEGVTASVDGLAVFDAFDGAISNRESLLHEGIGAAGDAPAAHEANVEIVVADRVWSLHLASTPAFEATNGVSPRLVTAVVGALVTLFLTGLVWAMATRERRASELTALRTAELEEARRTAESATRAKADFLANMSHELRTPLTAILGFIEFIHDPSMEPKERNQHLNTISRNGEHLLSIVNDLLDSAKIDAGRMTVERLACSPRTILEDVVSLLAHKAAEKRVALTLEPMPRWPESITTDPTRWKQVLVNIVGNALKFTERGSVRVRGRLVVEPERGETVFVVDIEDTGIGMTPQQRQNLFRPFRQADASTTRRFGGTGLGLSISKAFAEKLGGAITIESEYGRGSTFHVSIAAGPVVDTRPRTLAADSSSAAIATPAEPRIAGRILLAEDSRDNQVLISRVLRKAGATVEIVGDGAMAIDAAWAAHERGSPFGLIFMDMHMPEVDGLEATKRLRALGYTGVIVALTASAMIEDRQACERAGCDGFASKPLKPTELMALCRLHLRTVPAN